eukprot:5840257-Ditylum_brightwellii.AAC.2
MLEMLGTSTIGTPLEATTTAWIESATYARSDYVSLTKMHGVVGKAKISPMHCSSSLRPSQDMSPYTNLSDMYLS